MRITEEEKKEILSKYLDETSDELLQHMKRTFPFFEQDVEFKGKPLKQISIDGKTYNVENNKKYLVNKLSIILQDDWEHLGVSKLKRTVKKFIDEIK